MGAYLAQPNTGKESSDDSNDVLEFGSSSMQGWRTSQEDAHNSILDFGNNSSFFAVYDGHGGAEVALYCAANLPKFLRIHKQYVMGNYEQALREAFVDFDGTLVQTAIIEELRKLKPDDKRASESGDDDEDYIDGEDLAELCQEGHMPLAELLERYKEVRAKRVTDENIDTAAEETQEAKDMASCSSATVAEQSARRTTNTAARASSFQEGASLGTTTSKNSTASDNAAANEDGIETKSGPSKEENGNSKVTKVEIESEATTSDSDDAEDAGIWKSGKPVSKKLAKSSSSDSDDDDDEEDEDENDDEDEEDDDDDDDDDEACEVAEEDDDSFVNNMVERPGSSSGCTAVVALLVERELFVANAGDSRCVVCRGDQALEMSFDHKPEDEPEQKRIEKAGGKVSLDGRVNGGLNLSRAIGDHAYKQNKDLEPEEQMISPLPDIKRATIGPEDKFMIIACDGIWNFMTSQEAIDFVRERIDEGKKLSIICEELFTACLAPNTMGDGTGCDNMTAVIVRFKEPLYARPLLQVAVSNKRLAPAPTSEDLNTSGNDHSEKKMRMADENESTETHAVDEKSSLVSDKVIENADEDAALE